MKKLMISTIILLPLLMLAIMLVSGAIISLVTHIYVESVEFVDNETLVLVMDDEKIPPQEQLEVNVLPLKAENRALTFAVEDESIASVDENGILTAKYFGETYVTVASKENAAATAKRKVIVTDNSVHSLKIGAFERDMYQGETQRLSVEVLPLGATNKQVRWSSSDDALLSVTQSGEVKCLAAGTATVTATSVDNPQATATAEISCHMPLIGISADDTPVVTAQKSERFPAIVPAPANATYTVEYSVSDGNIAKADADGKITFYKEGSVTVTATAFDGRGNTDSVSVRYDCTYGYYTGPLFEKTAYAFDYDAIRKGAEGEVPLDAVALQKIPNGSYRKIVSVSFDREGVLEFDEATEKFLLKNVGDGNALGAVKITVRAEKYDVASGEVKEFDTDVCTVTIARNTAALSFVAKGANIGAAAIATASVGLSEIVSGSAASGIGVLAEPANHTDRLFYEISEGGSIARLNGLRLEFFEVGTATVRVAAKDPSGTEHASAELTVTYAKAGKSQVVVTADDETAEQNIVLDFMDRDNLQTGVLQFSTPEGYTANCVSSAPEIVRVGEDGVSLIPQRGGFATATVSFAPDPATPDASSAPPSLLIHIYVDKPMEAANISFAVGENAAVSDFTTSKESVRYTVSLDAPDGAMEGKEFCLGGEKAELAEENGKLVCRETVEFGGKKNLTVSASVRYGAAAEEYERTGEQCGAECRFRTTDGDLGEAPKVACGGQPVTAAGNRLDFANIGETIELTIDASEPFPRDFELTEEKISFTVNDYFDMTASLAENKAVLTLTAKKGTYGEVATTLQVAGFSFEFAMNVSVPADTLEVKYGASALSQGTVYATFLTSLDLTVKISRKDGAAITAAEKKVRYSLGDGEFSSCEGDNVTFTLSPEGAQTLTVKSGIAEFSCTLEKRGLQGLDFEFHIEYPVNGGMKSLEPFGGEERYTAIFPQEMQGNFDLCIALKSGIENRLGGFDDRELNEYFKLTAPEGWDVSFETAGSAAKFVMTVPKTSPYFTDAEFTLRYGERSVTLLLNKTNVARVEFTGFDNGNENDVRLGYQQVRVFAKQSDYKGVTGDHLRVPLVAESDPSKHTPADPSSLVWKLVRHSDKDGEGDTLLVSQRGTEVICGNETYTIQRAEGCSSLTLNGAPVAQGGKYVSEKRIPWVDVFAEKGYAHIYFGGFNGLSESDVQNDYFGNFGEDPEWRPTAAAANDGSGRNFTPSGNAYSFLRVEAGDGAKDSRVNAHFNFNVLDDPDLVNVFDATGYYKHAKVVLHSDLYGPGELSLSPEKETEAAQADLILTQTTSSATSKDTNLLGKTAIYGNGHQINLEARNKILLAHFGDKRNDSDGTATQFGTLCNVTVKGANPTEEIGTANLKQYILLNGAYYSDIGYYTKVMSPQSTSDRTFTVKNSVLRYAFQAVLVYTYERAYFENVVVTECLLGITSMGNGNNHSIYLKGFVDSLNYSVVSEFSAKFPEFGGFIQGGMINGYPWMEWFGKEKDLSGNNALIDPVIISLMAGVSAKVNVWDGKQYNEISKMGTQKLENGIGIEHAIEYMGIMNGYLYDAESTVDGGPAPSNSKTGERDMAQLFTPDRDIRLLCEYKTKDSRTGKLVKNEDHILWHIQKVYRDPSLIDKRTENHIDALKASLRGTVWPDGTEADRVIGTAAALNELISHTVLPSKRSY